MTVTGLIFSKKSREALHEANVSTASLSLIGCVFILLNVLVLAPSTRQSRAARLIYMLAVADFDIASRCYRSIRPSWRS